MFPGALQQHDMFIFLGVFGRYLCMQAQSLGAAQREQLATSEQQAELVRAFVDGLEKQSEALKQQQPELAMQLGWLLEAAWSDQRERRTTEQQQQQQADLVSAPGETLHAALGKQHEHAAASQQQQLACIRELLEQQRKQHEEQQRLQEANWQLLLASSQRQEQLLLKLLERLDTPAPPAATLAPGQQRETAAAAEGGEGGSPDVPASGLRLGEREESAAASSHGDPVACRQPAVGSTGTGTTRPAEQQQQQQQQQDESVPPRLLDYVRVREEVRIPRSRGGRHWEDVISAGAEGVVLASADGGTRLKVRPHQTAVCCVRAQSRNGVLCTAVHVRAWCIELLAP